MPWSANEAKSHTKKADTPDKQKKWAKIANAALKTYKGDEGKAIATANAAMGDSFWIGDGFQSNAFFGYLRLLDKSGLKLWDRRVECPDCDGDGEDDNGNDCQTCGGDGWIDDGRDPDDPDYDDDEHDPEDDDDNLNHEHDPGDEEDDILNLTSDGNVLVLLRDGTLLQIDDQGEAKSPYGDVDYADPGYQKDKKKRYPTDTADHIRAGWNYINKQANADKYSSGDLAKVKAKIVAAWKSKIDKAGPPSAKDSRYRTEVHSYIASVRSADSMAKGSIRLNDKIDLKDANITYRKDGSILAMPRTARTGIQLYSGDECGRPDLPMVKVYRPPEEVFDKAALRSYVHRTVTLDHPNEDVNSTNWKNLAVGWTGDEILRDGETFRVPMMLADANAVSAYKDKGVKELSWGYDCVLDWTPGTTKDGQPYDAVQRRLRANHLAVVTSARGGSSLAIGDSAGRNEPDSNRNRATEYQMNQPLKTLTLDSPMGSLEVTMDDASAKIVQRTVNSLQSQIDKLIKDAKKKEEEDEEKNEDNNKKDAALVAKDKKIGELAAQLSTKDAEIATLKQQLTDANKAASPAALDKMVLDRLDVIRKAKQALGGSLTIDGKTVAEIRRLVVDAKLKDVARGWDDKQIEAAFASIQVPNFTAGGENRYTPVDSAVEAFRRSSPGYIDQRDPRQVAYDSRDEALRDAWKYPNGNPHHDDHDRH